jgi:hypothetical protein
MVALNVLMALCVLLVVIGSGLLWGATLGRWRFGQGVWPKGLPAVQRVASRLLAIGAAGLVVALAARAIV